MKELTSALKGNKETSFSYYTELTRKRDGEKGGRNSESYFKIIATKL